MISMNEQHYNRLRLDDQAAVGTDLENDSKMQNAVDTAVLAVKKFAAEQPTAVVAVGLAVGVAAGWLIKRR